MSNNKKLFADAIADAKALREVAVANAKASLEESFMPRIQSMFEKRIMEAEELEEAEDELDEKITYTGDKDDLLDSLDETEDLEEIYDDSMEEEIDLEELFNSLEEEEDMYETMSTDEEAFSEGEEMEEDFNLEEILAELEEESSEINEEEDELNENTMFEKATGAEDISEVTVDELRDMIQDAIKAVMGGEAEDKDMGMDMNVDMGDEGEEVNMGIDMEDEEETEEKPEKKSKKDELDELYALYERKKKEKEEKEMNERRKYKGASKDEKELDEVSNAPYGAKGDKKGGPYNKGSKKLHEVDVEAKEKELEEAINVIRTLRSQLNEVNLLNAKLIYVNKLFKNNNLNENQKVNVVNSFDKAQTLTEAKNIYEVLKNTVKSTKVATKAPLREHKSFASSVIGGKTAKSPIINADDTITRMQQLAGIIKN